MQRSVFVEEADQAANLALIAATLIGSAVVVQFFRPWWNATSDAFVAVPALYALAVAGAILIVFLLRVRLTVVDNDRLRWMSVGLMFAGIAALFQGVVIADLREVPELVSPSGAAALSGIWHGALALFALGGALTPHRHRLRRGLTLLIGTLLAVVLFEPAWAVLPAVVDAQGRLTATQRFGIMILLVLTLTAAGAWIAVRGRRATRPDVWIVIMLLLAGLDLAFALKARLWVEAVWWNAVVLRAAQFVVPGVGLLADNARLVGLLRRHEQGLQGQLDREAELAIRAVARTVPDADAEARILQVLTDEAFTPVFQPIVTLGSGELLAVEALTRFVTDPPRTPDQWFDEAHALGRGLELELAALQVALTAARALPDDLPFRSTSRPPR